MLRFRLSLFLLLGCTVGWAQTQLVVVEAGGEHVVWDFEGDVPRIMDEPRGTLRTSDSRNFKLRPAESYATGSVALRGLNYSFSHTIHVATMPRAVDFKDRPLTLRADYSPANPLTSLFLTLELNDQGVILARNLPIPPAGEWEKLKLEIKQIIPSHNDPVTPFKAVIRFFSHGQELPKSVNRLEDLQVSIDRTIANAIQEKDLRTAKLKVFSRANPIYPESLKTRSIGGSASIRCVVDPRGRVTEASILSATHPEFGEAAKAATLLWRFIPKIESRKPVTSAVTIPFNFSPASPSRDDSTP